MVEQARTHTNDSLTKITIPYLNRENDNAMAVDRGKRTGWKTINKIYEKKKKVNGSYCEKMGEMGRNPCAIEY